MAPFNCWLLRVYQYSVLSSELKLLDALWNFHLRRLHLSDWESVNCICQRYGTSIGLFAFSPICPTYLSKQTTNHSQSIWTPKSLIGFLVLASSRRIRRMISQTTHDTGVLVPLSVLALYVVGWFPSVQLNFFWSPSIVSATLKLLCFWLLACTLL